MFVAVVLKRRHSKWCLFYTGSGVPVPPTATHCSLPDLERIITTELPRHQGHVFLHGWSTSVRQVPSVFKAMPTVVYSEVLRYFKHLYLPWSREFVRFYARSARGACYQFFCGRKNRKDRSLWVKLECDEWGDKWVGMERVAGFFKKQDKPFRGRVPGTVSFEYDPHGALKFGLVLRGSTVRLEGDETLRMQESLSVKSLLPPGFYKKIGVRYGYRLESEVGTKKLTWPAHEVNLQELRYLQRAIEQTNAHFRGCTIDYQTPPSEHGVSDPDCQVYGWDIPVAATWSMRPAYLGPARILRKDVDGYEYRFNVHGSVSAWVGLYLLSAKLPRQFYKQQIHVKKLSPGQHQDFLLAPAGSVALLKIEEDHSRWCYKTGGNKIIVFNSHNIIGALKGGHNNFKTLQKFCEEEGGVDINFYSDNDKIYDQLSEGSCTVIAFCRALQMCREQKVESVLSPLDGSVVMFAKAFWEFGKAWTANYARLAKTIRIAPRLHTKETSSYVHLPTLTFPKSLFGSSRRVYLYLQKTDISLVMADHQEPQTSKTIQKVLLPKNVRKQYITPKETLDLNNLHVWMEKKVNMSHLLACVKFFFQKL